MIYSFKHKGLRNFFETGTTAGINSLHAKRLKIILQRLHAAISPQDMNTPGMHFHKLIGSLSAFYSVSVSANWRVIFKFRDGQFEDVDYVDYH